MKFLLLILLTLNSILPNISSANQDEFDGLKTLTCLEVSSLYGDETDFIIEIFRMEVILTYDISLELAQEKKDDLVTTIESVCANEANRNLFLVVEAELRKLCPECKDVTVDIDSEPLCDVREDGCILLDEYNSWPEKVKIDPISGNIDRASAKVNREKYDAGYIERGERPSWYGVGEDEPVQCNGRAGGIKNTSIALPNLKLPYPDGKSHLFGQGWGGKNTHWAEGNEHSLDFGMEDGVDLVLAVGPGRVMEIREDSETKCSSREECGTEGNYVLVDHGNGYYAEYYHLHPYSVVVEPGDIITEGNFVLAKGGCSGWCFFPHLHFEMRDMDENCTVEYTLDGISDFTDVGRENFLQGNKISATRGKEYKSTNLGDQIWDKNKISKIGKNRFFKDGIILSHEISWDNHRVGDKIRIAGKIINGKSKIAIRMYDSTFRGTNLDENGNVIGSTHYIDSDHISAEGIFDIFYDVPDVGPGAYRLIITTIPQPKYGTAGFPTILIEDS